MTSMARRSRRRKSLLQRAELWAEPLTLPGNTGSGDRRTRESAWPRGYWPLESYTSIYLRFVWTMAATGPTPQTLPMPTDHIPQTTRGPFRTPA